jgi:mannosyltransferase
MTNGRTQRHGFRIENAASAISACSVLGAFVLGLVARVWELGKRSLWYDELFCVVGAATSRSLEELRRQWMDIDGHPPGYMIFLHGWFQIVPATEIWARVPCTAVSVALLLYLAASRFEQVSRSARLYIVALYAVSYEAIYYAQTSRQYGILMACSIGALLEWVAIFDTEEAKHRNWLRLVAWLIVAAYVHYFSLLLGAAIFGCALVWKRRRQRELKIVFAYTALFCLVYAPGFLTLLHKVQLRIAGWQTNQPVTELVEQLVLHSFFGTRTLVASFGFVVLATVLVAHGRSLRTLATRLGDRSLGAVFAVLVLIAAALAALSFVGPFLQLRYALILYAPLLLTTAFALARLAPLENWSGAIVACSILVLGLGAYGEYRQTQKQDWRRSAEYVIEHSHKTDAIYVVGTDPNRAAIDYLRDHDVDGYFYCRTLPFYAYYFKRLGRPQFAERLTQLPLAADVQRATLDASTASTLFVLAPHHTKIEPAALSELEAHGFRIVQLQFFSTRVYRLDRARIVVR